MKRTLKAGHPSVNVEKPRCRDHRRTQMVFNPARMVWECPEKGCSIIAHPPDEIGGSRPRSFGPPFELLHVVNSDTGAEQFILRKEKVFFDITDIVTSVTMRGKQDAVIVIPNEWIRIDENGNRLE